MSESGLSIKQATSIDGSIEPHAPILQMPPLGQLVYKVTSIDNLLRSISEMYLHFNRLDAYSDFEKADLHDGEQTHQDKPINSQVNFEKNPEFTVAHYYNQFRSRAYACCFSLENSPNLWKNYGAQGVKGKVGIEFDFFKLRSYLNTTLQSNFAALMVGDVICKQIFSINYGIVKYVDWYQHREALEVLPNPITYVYLKDQKYSDEKELRISLSTIGIGHFGMKDGSIIEFPKGLMFTFDFRQAIEQGVITRLLVESSEEAQSLSLELNKHHMKVIVAQQI
jgi:hypothetical protein